MMPGIPLRFRWFASSCRTTEDSHTPSHLSLWLSNFPGLIRYLLFCSGTCILIQEWLWAAIFVPSYACALWCSWCPQCCSWCRECWFSMMYMNISSHRHPCHILHLCALHEWFVSKFSPPFPMFSRFVQCWGMLLLTLRKSQDPECMNTVAKQRPPIGPFGSTKISGNLLLSKSPEDAARSNLRIEDLAHCMQVCDPFESVSFHMQVRATCVCRSGACDIKVALCRSYARDIVLALCRSYACDNVLALCRSYAYILK